jgi:enoyl-CoA hydratase/carnithine racemase
MSYEQILYSDENGIATITLNRPNKLNAWTRGMAAEVRDAMYRASDDDAVKVIVLTGSGRGFCAGADMSELKDASSQETSNIISDKSLTAEQKASVIMGQKMEEELNPENPDNIRADFRKRYSYLMAINKPIIAAINGPAIGLGLVIPLYCDIRFASEKAIFSTAFSRRGLIAEHGFSWLLPRIIGIPNSFDLLYSARTINAIEAKEMGLVNMVFPEEDLMKEVNAYAKELVEAVSPRSMGVMKHQVYCALFQGLAEALTEADEEFILSMQSEDFKEGVEHFLEKRPPRFTGK